MYLLSHALDTCFWHQSPNICFTAEFTIIWSVILQISHFPESSDFLFLHNISVEWLCCQIYRQISNIGHTLLGNKIVDHSDVFGALTQWSYTFRAITHRYVVRIAIIIVEQCSYKLFSSFTHNCQLPFVNNKHFFGVKVLSLYTFVVV